MFAFPKLVLLILVVGVVWIACRWVDRAARELQRRRAPPRAIAAEDLAQCTACGAYVAVHAGGCARQDCPRPRRAPTFRDPR
jgi:hypothetical protein